MTTFAHVLRSEGVVYDKLGSWGISPEPNRKGLCRAYLTQLMFVDAFLTATVTSHEKTDDCDRSAIPDRQCLAGTEPRTSLFGTGCSVPGVTRQVEFEVSVARLSAHRAAPRRDLQRASGGSPRRSEPASAGADALGCDHHAGRRYRSDPVACAHRQPLYGL